LQAQIDNSAKADTRAGYGELDGSFQVEFAACKNSRDEKGHRVAIMA
jgi:hypothetical protein